MNRRAFIQKTGAAALAAGLGATAKEYLRRVAKGMDEIFAL